jgi:hypothetical protein
MRAAPPFLLPPDPPLRQAGAAPVWRRLAPLRGGRARRAPSGGRRPLFWRGYRPDAGTAYLPEVYEVTGKNRLRTP